MLGGCGLGLGYVSPVSTLIRWFPDRRGMATGMAIMGFGGGAMIATPLKEWLLGVFFRAPERLGGADEVATVTAESGALMARQGEVQREVVVATAADLKDLPMELAEGVYAVGTGNSGAAMTFLVLGALYFVVMIVASFMYKVPAADWTPAGWDPEAAAKRKSMITTQHVGVNRALATPQFYLLWIVLCLNVTAGIGVLGVAKTMIKEIFQGNLPMVTSAFAATFVLMISVFNMCGRFFWASISDYLGRKNTYTVFFVLGAALYALIPYTAWNVVGGDAMWLWIFYAASMVIFTMYGGGFATIPAYLADLFGTRYVGGIHGRLLTAWSMAGVLGPLLIGMLRSASLNRSLHDLAAKVDPAVFEQTFGKPLAELDTLIGANTVTVARLMELVPAGTPDPTSGLYNTTMFTMAALLVVALVANLLVRPVHDSHHLDD